MSSECWEFWDSAFSPLLPLICHQADLKADLALAALPLAFVQADHEGLVALLPVQCHGLVTLAEDLNLILLHVGDNLRNKNNTNTKTTLLLFKQWGNLHGDSNGKI